MRKILIALALAAPTTPAYAATSYLVATWTENGNQFCRYDNGTVLNMGARVCPLRIGG